MRNFTQGTFPKKWVILSNKEEYESTLVDYINEEFSQDLSKGLGGVGSWYYFNDKIRHPTLGDYQYYLPGNKPLPEGFELITFEEFKKYVLNKDFDTNPEDTSYLIEFFTKNDIL